MQCGWGGPIVKWVEWFGAFKGVLVAMVDRSTQATG